MPTACIGLLELRGYIGARTAPSSWLSAPSGPVTATRPWWTLSMVPLRTTSTTIGSMANGSSPVAAERDCVRSGAAVGCAVLAVSVTSGEATPPRFLAV